MTKIFIMRQGVFLWRRFCGKIYMDTMIASVMSSSVNMVAEVYIIDFGDVRIYLLPNRNYAQTSL